MYTENAQVPGPNKRVCAYLIDICLAGWLGAALAQVAGASAGSLLTGGLILFRDQLGQGTSPGKRLCGLELVSVASEADISSRQSVIRNAIFALPYFVGGLSVFMPWLALLPALGVFLASVTEYIFMRLRPDGRRLGDQWAKTQLLSTRPGQADSMYLLYALLVLLIGFWRLFEDGLYFFAIWSESGASLEELVMGLLMLFSGFKSLSS